MAAPAVTARVVPTGYKLPDGFKTTIALSSNPAIQFWEKTIKPPGWDGGEKIDNTTMLNIAWRTFGFRSLKTLTDATVNAGYDPQVFVAINNEMNLPQSITVHFPENSSLAFYGAMTKFEPQENKEGEFPMAAITFSPSNWDYVNQVEAGPLFTPAAGTP